MTNKQLETWSGDFGKAYTDRNVVDYHTRIDAYSEILSGLPVHRVLEVGCNRGHNLLAVGEVLGEQCELIGVEPNPYARELARASSPKLGVLFGQASDLPLKDGYVDLAFTSGVLSHVALENLPAAMREICRVSNRYVLALEIYAEDETIVPYRGHDDLLWKRDFLKIYQDSCPELKLVSTGYIGPEQGYDRAHWWLMEKNA